MQSMKGNNSRLFTNVLQILKNEEGFRTIYEYPREN